MEKEQHDSPSHLDGLPPRLRNQLIRRIIEKLFPSHHGRRERKAIGSKDSTKLLRDGVVEASAIIVFRENSEAEWDTTGNSKALTDQPP